MTTFYDAGAAGGLGKFFPFGDLNLYIFFNVRKPSLDVQYCVGAVKGVFVCFCFTSFDDGVDAIWNMLI